VRLKLMRKMLSVQEKLSPANSKAARRGSIWTTITRRVTIPPVIRSWKCRDTQALHARNRVRRFAAIEAVARRKLRQLDIAARLDDLRIPPGNRLEALKGDRAGQYGIRINDQWRLCLRWRERAADEVEIVDYH